MTPPAPPWTPERVAEAKALCEAATPGPWTFKPCEVESDPIGGDFVSSAAFLNEPYKVDCGDYLGLNDADAAFIAAARTALPDALVEIERLQVTNSAAVDDAQRRADAAEARWEALKAGVAEIYAHWASFHSVAPAAVFQVQGLIAQLEREPPPIHRERCE